ncbi:amidohydrolase family protein [Pelagovum pacificum]|uniref:amidohydrolase family protein n=1 Tax=Pelagovum pacificum TaxID=2588711 RepID=UPI001E34E564|nr:amidohydrolase family protein [Pelagovum pacificum]
MTDGRITTGPFPAVDLSGYFVLPGIVDTGNLSLERHLYPAPGLRLPLDLALRALERESAANGITTGWIAQDWTWGLGPGSPDRAEALLHAVDLQRADAAIDLRVQLRYETFDHDSAERMVAAVRRYGVDFVLFQSACDRVLDLYAADPDSFARHASAHGLASDHFLDLLERARDRRKEVPRRLCRVAEAFDVLGVVYGSTGDPDGETREYFSMLGAKVCDRPTSFQAASVARAVGDPVVMGAPQVVLPDSTRCAVSPLPLIRAGKCDALASDVWGESPVRAAFQLSDLGILPFAAAWSLLSSRPARILRLPDRGEIAPGKRADLIVVNKATRAVEATFANGRLAFATGEAATRLIGGDTAVALAAE